MLSRQKCYVGTVDPQPVLTAQRSSALPIITVIAVRNILQTQVITCLSVLRKKEESFVFFCTFGKNVSWAIKCFLLGENSLPRDNRKESLGEKLGRRPGDWFANPAVVNWLCHPRLREVPSIFSRPQVCNLSGAECRASILQVAIERGLDKEETSLTSEE